MNAIKAEDIIHVLRDGVALLHGGRCRTGEPLLVFPSREQPVNPDHLRNVLLYLLTVTADSAREKGFLVVIDMRGKQTWTNVRPILKTLNTITETSVVNQVYIIKPEKFWEKQKTQMSLGTWKFEVEMVSFEALSKIVDVSQLPRNVGGTHPYDHDDWLEIRLELEKWIWSITEVMASLETVRKEMVESEHPIDVKTAEQAVKRHAAAKRTIFTIPVEKIENDAHRICERISNPRNGHPNPDLLASLPHVTNLVDSLRLRKGDVFKQWDNRRGDLEKLYHQKLFEHDAEKILEMIRSYSTTVVRSIGDVGMCEADVGRLTKDFEQFQTAVQVEMAAVRLQDEWCVLQDLLTRRRQILSHAKAFFNSSQKYFAELPDWTAKPGVNPSEVKIQPADSLEEAIKRHETFWAHVEEIYAQAFDDGSKVTKALKEAEAEDNVAREQLNRLTRAHKQLHDKWKERKVLLHHMLAMIAFETDVKLVVEWLDQHGEPYLKKNINIGENVVQARTLQRNHQNFQKVAANTYDNVKKLYQVYKNVTESGSKMCDVEKMRSLMTDLDLRIKKFTNRVETRGNLLKLSVLFHTHYVELTNWFGEMKRKFEDKTIDMDVEACEKSKERWVLESDETAQAYAVTVGEGKALIQEMQNAAHTCDIDYSQSINHIHRLIADIDERNATLSNEWAPQRVILQIALKFAIFCRNNWDVMQQIRSWEEDMREMVESETFFDKADTVLPYHKDNQIQVRTAINNIRKTAKELNQALHAHGIADLCVRDGRRVIELIKDNVRILDQAEKEVMKCADETCQKIEAACEVVACRNLADGMISMIEREERHLASLGGIPANCREAEVAQDVLKDFQGKIEKRLKEPYNVFVQKWRELMQENRVERDVIVAFNEQIQSKWRRLTALCDERNKLLKAAIACYKTYEEGVVPILQQLAKDYSQPQKDWCAQCPSTSHQEKVDFILELLEKHMEYKDRFIKGCCYAQKNGEIFLRYIQRTNVRSHERRRIHEERIAHMKEDIRDRQSNILELWMKKKTQLDHCHSYVLLDASRIQIFDWLNGEGEQKLREFEKRGRNTTDKNSDEFGSFKLLVKEKKTNIQAFLMMAADIKDKESGANQHSDEIDAIMKDVKEKFEKFSKRVAACEVILRGENSQKDEFSLDRHSDTSIFDDKMVNVRREENRKMLEPMRELLKSERDYIEDLERCVKIYITEYDNALKNGTLAQSLRSLRGEIFGNIEKIYTFHNDKLLHELEKYETQPEAVGASFTVWIDLLNELYTEYCVNKEQKNYVIATPDAVAFFNGVREKHNLEINNDVGSLLIKPVQRITRYRLLMEQLLKNCTGNSEELREAYEVVISVPRRVNDIIHYNCLDLKDSNVDVLGPFVIQDMLTVWEPRAYFKGRGKERQVFLFELAIVFAKRLEISPKNVRYVIKGKPLPLSEVSVVEHVEGDTARFGLRVGTVASNDNRTDLKASSEKTKVMWVRKIRELTQGLLTLNLGVSSALSVPSTSSGGPRSVSIRSGASTSSGDRLSQDVESLMQHRHSVQSVDSEICPEEEKAKLNETKNAWNFVAAPSMTPVRRVADLLRAHDTGHSEEKKKTKTRGEICRLKLIGKTPNLPYLDELMGID
ncbi:unnamed protein product [Caenorhabditis bovis]|uniref:Uncharacterized protein n=1 Tax=Caenorhabditis bovis TaxID=2654633 RepID=A0A8S1F936_9PELO|nr:unnamed protein product [Caenorhabditis bovis]